MPVSRHGSPLWLHRLLWTTLLGMLGGLWAWPQAHATEQAQEVVAQAPERSLSQWLARLRQASAIPSYVGTYVVSNRSGVLSSARIWHACQGELELERVDMLTGAPRSAFRRGDEVTLFLPHARVVRTQRHASGSRFPDLFREDPGSAVDAHYEAYAGGRERVAGLEAEVVELAPRDAHRYGYRVWSEHRTGLILKTQMIDRTGAVLEQAAFSEVQLNLPAQVVEPHLAMPSVDDLVVEDMRRDLSSVAERGWQLKQPAAGFEPRHCFKRLLRGEYLVDQCVFSDGLASISMFFEPFTPERHGGARESSLGATHALSGRWPGAQGAWWITLVGEVPGSTLRMLAASLERVDP